MANFPKAAQNYHTVFPLSDHIHFTDNKQPNKKMEIKTNTKYKSNARKFSNFIVALAHLTGCPPRKRSGYNYTINFLIFSWAILWNGKKRAKEWENEIHLISYKMNFMFFLVGLILWVIFHVFAVVLINFHFIWVVIERH